VQMKTAILFAVVWLFSATMAQAFPITWTINATLDDGATANGFFVSDPDIGFQQITNFDISISAAPLGTLIPPADLGLPTSVFFPFNFTPLNSNGSGPLPFADGAFLFLSRATFPNPFQVGPPEALSFRFVPVSPLSDASSTTIDNSNIKVNSPFSTECFNCAPSVCFAGATSDLCIGRAAIREPSSYALALASLVLFVSVVMLRSRDGGAPWRAQLLAVRAACVNTRSPRGDRPDTTPRAL
jgi:hypothetical protein